MRKTIISIAALVALVLASTNAPGGAFTVMSATSETGWTQQASMPAGPKLKNVKDGGCAAYSGPTDDSGHVFALKGNNRYEFYVYNTVSNTWATRESIPAIGSTGKKKAVKRGSAIAAAGTKLYAAKGGNTLEFWQFDPALSGTPTYPWTAKAIVPLGTRAMKEGTGAAGVKIGGTNYVYLLKGAGTTEFYRYNTVTNTWEARANAPTGASGRTYKDGSCMAATEDGKTIYLLKGSYNEFYAYRVDSDHWTTLTILPFTNNRGKNTKAKSGASMASHGHTVYVVKANNTGEFWSFQTDSGRWRQLPDVPPGPAGKRPKAGAALTFGSDANALFLLKGNNTLEFWKYGLSAAYANGEVRSTNDEQDAASGVRPSTFALRTFPNPFSSATTISYSLPRAGNVSLRLYDATGKLVSILASGHHDAGRSSFIVHRSSLACGIYLLKLETRNPELETQVTTSQLIIE